MSNTPAIAGTDQRAMVSDALLQKALAGRTPEQITALIGETAVSAIVAAQTPPATPAASEDAGDKPMKKGKGKKDKMESEDGEYDDEDEPMAQDRAAVVFASEHSQGRERVAAECLASFPGATASQITSFLSKQPKAEPKAEAPEGTAELASAIRHNNSNLGEGGNAAPQADASAIWDKAIKANNPHINR